MSSNTNLDIWFVRVPALQLSLRRRIAYLTSHRLGRLLLSPWIFSSIR